METTNASSQSFFSELVSDIKKSYLDLFRPIILNILFMDISCVKSYDAWWVDYLIILEKLQASSVYVNTLETIYINQRIIQHLFFIFIGVFFHWLNFFTCWQFRPQALFLIHLLNTLQTECLYVPVLLYLFR